VIHDFGDVIELCYANFFGSGQSLCPKPGIIRRDKVVVIESWAKRGSNIREEDGNPCSSRTVGGVFRTGFSVKDGEPIYLYRAITVECFRGVPFPARGPAAEILRASEKPPVPYEKPSRIPAKRAG